MVDLMLQQFGKRPLGVHLLFLAPGVQVLHADAIGALYLDHEVWERETTVPNQKVLRTDVGYFRIEEQPGFVDL